MSVRYKVPSRLLDAYEELNTFPPSFLPFTLGGGNKFNLGEREDFKLSYQGGNDWYASSDSATTSCMT